MIGFAARMVLRSLARRARRSSVTFTGVALAVASLVVLAALMEGVGDAMIRNSVAVQVGHVHLAWSEPPPLAAENSSSLAVVPDLRTALWRKRSEAMIGKGDRRIGAIVYAVEPAVEQKESVVPLKIVSGTYLTAADGVVLGLGLASDIGATVGDTVRVQRAGGEPADFRVEGVYRTGIEYLDRSAFTNYAAMPGPANELAVYLYSPTSSDPAAAALCRLFPGARVVTWEESLPELVQLLALNRVAMNVVFVLALLILAFGISNTAFMSVNERTRELGILQAMGMRPWQIVLVILGEMAVLVGAAAVTGIALGSGASEIMRHTGLDLGAWTSANRHFLVSGVIYTRLTPYAVLTPGLMAMACVLLAGIVPAWRGATADVVRSLRWV
jgi:ABC-type lipoprotein release transport system permease subunit